MHAPGPGDSAFDYKIEAKNVHFLSIGPHLSVPKRILSIPNMRKIITENKHKIDCALLRGPSPLLSAMFKSLEPVPTALLFVGDYLSGISDLPQPLWRKQIIKLWAYWNSYGQNIAASKCLVFVNSRKLYEGLKDIAREIIETRTTNLSERDFYDVKDRCNNQRYRLLYTGRIDTTKGLFELVDAVKILWGKNLNVCLDIVGDCAKGDPTRNNLDNYIDRNHLREYIVLHGYKPFGPELFEFYKRADIFLMASYAEGFPRAIWEAMAYSVPVIATKVGSIPHYLKDKSEALLIPPKDPFAIAEAVKLLIEDSVLRRQMIERAKASVRQNTLEKRAAELAGYLKDKLFMGRTPK